MRLVHTLVPALLIAAAPASAAPRDTYERSVVTLTVTGQSWDGARPWAKRAPVTRRGSAVVVATDTGPMILTTAQMLVEATLVQLETFGRDTAATPRLALLDPTVDLALLSVDPKALAGIKPVALAKRTPRYGTLRTARWLDQQLETAASRIRHFQVEQSSFGGLEHVFLLVQTDISGGGWAEPVFEGDRLVGLTANQDERQRARIIPVEILAAFLRRASDSRGYRGFPGWEASWQPKTDTATSAFFGQTGVPRGVLIRRVPCGTTGADVFRPRDILSSVDGREIDGDGSYSDPRLGQVRFGQLFQEGREVGDSVPVRVLRDKRPLDLHLTLRRASLETDLMPERRLGAPPAYSVMGGLVFRELDGEYLELWGNAWQQQAPAELVTRYMLERYAQRPGRRRVIILSSVLPAPYNVGYQDLRDMIVESINGRPIDSVASVTEAFRHPRAGFHTVRFAPNGSRREIVLDAATLDEASAKILEQYNVPAAFRPAQDEPAALEGECGPGTDDSPSR